MFIVKIYKFEKFFINIYIFKIRAFIVCKIMTSNVKLVIFYLVDETIFELLCNKYGNLALAPISNFTTIISLKIVTVLFYRIIIYTKYIF